jgi:hypothetical protein
MAYSNQHLFNITEKNHIILGLDDNNRSFPPTTPEEKICIYIGRIRGDDGIQGRKIC